jgi:DNA modification methylase
VSALMRADAVRIPLRDESVDLIVTSPPYFALRSYRDMAWVVGPDGQLHPEQVHYRGQIGSEPTPQAFLEALWAVMGECWRVLKPTGSCWINLGDKRAGSGGHNNSNLSSRWSTAPLQGGKKTLARLDADEAGGDAYRATRRNAPERYNQAAFGRPKSKMLLPHRFAIGCEDGLADPEGKGWIIRQDVVWQKLNGLPESVTDRCRDSHEYLFHLTKSERYFSAVDEVREPHTEVSIKRAQPHRADTGRAAREGRMNGGVGPAHTLALEQMNHPLGKLPGSVWPIASEPLILPEAVQQHYDLPDHFAAFPQELPRRIILGWSPSGICSACGEGRRPVVEKTPMVVAPSARRLSAQAEGNASRTATGGTMTQAPSATITGYACACPNTSAPTRPAVVLDPFAGTGTTCGVARALGRYGVGLDLSADYLRLARWRIWQSGHFAKTANRTNRERQGALL